MPTRPLRQLRGALFGEPGHHRVAPNCRFIFLFLFTLPPLPWNDQFFRCFFFAAFTLANPFLPLSALDNRLYCLESINTYL